MNGNQKKRKIKMTDYTKCPEYLAEEVTLHDNEKAYTLYLFNYDFGFLKNYKRWKEIHNYISIFFDVMNTELHRHPNLIKNGSSTYIIDRNARTGSFKITFNLNYTSAEEQIRRIQEIKKVFDRVHEKASGAGHSRLNTLEFENESPKFVSITHKNF